jgi:serine/threonine protein phosphatase PrpC
MIRAATLAGGSNNQDRYITGDGFAAVLDGATSVAGDRSHDPGWYAEQLAHAIGETVPRGGPLGDAVAEAIRMVRDAHDLSPETTPTSTVALARWSETSVETYALGDSYVVLLRSDGTEDVHTDDRLDSVGVDERSAYQKRLVEGHGYDAGHRVLLLELQAEQAQRRNRPDGYWIAGADPEAGRQGLSTTTDRAGVAALVLASDGIAIERQPGGKTWADLYRATERQGLDGVLEAIHESEAIDPDGRRWPRSKIHDDKTLVTIKLDPA